MSKTNFLEQLDQITPDVGPGTIKDVVCCCLQVRSKVGHGGYDSRSEHCPLVPKSKVREYWILYIGTIVPNYYYYGTTVPNCTIHPWRWT